MPEITIRKEISKRMALVFNRRVSSPPLVTPDSRQSWFGLVSNEEPHLRADVWSFIYFESLSESSELDSVARCARP